MEKVNTNEFLFEESSEPTRDLMELVAIARRQWKIVAIGGIVGLILGAIYVFTATPKYTATTTILIDSNNQELTSQVLSQQLPGLVDDESTVLSQVEILKSEKIADTVIDKLDLLNDPDFAASRGGMLGAAINTAKAFIKEHFSSTDANADDKDAARQQAVTSLLKNLTATRVGRTLLLQVDYTSISPSLSARISNAVVDAYLDDQLVSKYDASRRAGDWLEGRMVELQKKSLATDMAVQKFKADKGLISTSGQLITDQQLTAMSGQFVLAQSDTANAKAKLDSLQKVLDSGQINASVAESLNSQVLNTLQGEFLDASRREAELTSSVGADHLQSIRLRSQMAEYQRLMFEELNRIAETYRSNYEVAKSRQATLEQQMKDATDKSALANDDQVQLRELEREADTYRSLYETFMQRFQQTSQQQSFPVTEARVISPAQVPLEPSAPKKFLVLAFAFVAGCGIGSLGGAYRELGERFFRTGEQVRHELNLEFLGQVPLTPTKLNDRAPTKVGERGQRVISASSSIYRYVVDNPLSSFAETMRSAKIAADIRAGQRKGKVIGIVSVIPREGKSTVAINFAQHLAHQGARTLLIDGDLRNPGATRALGHNSDKGLYEVIYENEPLENVVLTDPKTGLAFLPSALKRRLPFSAELLNSAGMERTLANASNDFDYVVIDLPPMGPVVDARAMSSKIDSFLMVIEWGETARRLVRTAVQSNPTIMKRCAGVILNKVDMSKVNLYMNQDRTYYHNSKYGDYYLEES